jgi:hypothetical protein
MNSIYKQIRAKRDNRTGTSTFIQILPNWYAFLLFILIIQRLKIFHILMGRHKRRRTNDNFTSVLIHDFTRNTQFRVRETTDHKNNASTTGKVCWSRRLLVGRTTARLVPTRGSTRRLSNAGSFTAFRTGRSSSFFDAGLAGDLVGHGQDTGVFLETQGAIDKVFESGLEQRNKSTGNILIVVVCLRGATVDREIQ